MIGTMLVKRYFVSQFGAESLKILPDGDIQGTKKVFHYL